MQPRVIDRDSAEVAKLLSHAVTESGLSQAAFAQALGTSASRLSTYVNGRTSPSARFLVRAQRIAMALARATTGGLMTAPSTAAAIRASALAGDVDWMWRMLLQGRDHLALMLDGDDPTLRDSWDAAPATTGLPGWDALLAALTAHEFERADLTPPAWSQILPLEKPWAPEHPFLDATRARAQTPEWLGRLNVYVPDRDLVKA